MKSKQSRKGSITSSLHTLRLGEKENVPRKMCEYKYAKMLMC